MKKLIIYLLLTLYFQISEAQVIKSDIVLGTTEEGVAIRGIAKNTVPIDPTYGVFGYNLATNSNGIGVGGYTSGTGWGVYGFSQSGRGGYFTSSSGYALVTGAGFVGINLNPAARLHVGGNDVEKLRLENTTTLNTGINNELYFKTGAYFTGAIKTIGGGTQSARLGFFTFADNSPSGLFERLSIADGGNVGINIQTPLEKLHVAGNIRTSSLAGSGVRNVYADANGTLTSAAQTNYYSGIGAEFIPNNGDYASYKVSGAGAYFNDNLAHTLSCAIHIPNGATITKIKLYISDASANSLTLNLNSYNIFANGSSVTSLGTTNNATYEYITNTNIFVDNSINAYYINISGTWNTTNFQINGYKIEYTL